MKNFKNFLLIFGFISIGCFSQNIHSLNQNLCEGTEAKLYVDSIVNDIFAYQWQISDDSFDWENLISGNIYENVNTDTLIILNLAIDDHNSYFRCIVDSNSFGASVTSDSLIISLNQELNGPLLVDVSDFCIDHAQDVNLVSPYTLSTNNYTWTSSSEEALLFSQEDFSVFVTLNELGAETFYLEIQNSCYTSSDSIVLNAFNDISSLEISSSQSVCSTESFSNLLISTYPDGADSLFNYQWQMSFEGIDWFSISGEVDTILNPNFISTDALFRLLTFSDILCDSVYSNEVSLIKYDPLLSGELSEDQIVCYLTSPTIIDFSVLPSGSVGLNDYTYQWEFSLDLETWEEVENATSISLQAEVLTQTTYYRVRVSSLYDCGIVFTQALTVTVYDEQQTGSIVGADSICQFQSPNNVEVELIAFGGAPFYQYNWQFSDDGGSWNDISNSNFVILPDSILTDTTFFRVEFLNFCDNLISNAIEVIVWPLPIEIDIIGDFQPCLNSFNQVYEVSEFSPLYNYNWGIVNGEITSFDNSHEVEVHWDSINSSSLINVVEINKITGCSKTVEQNINLSYGSAPNKTEILRMDNSNILVCKDSTELINYSWGYVITETNETVYIDNSNQRYVQLDHDFDNIKYDYFVITLYMYDDYSCETISYFDTNDELNVNEYYNQPFVYPNPFSNEFYLVNFQDVISVSLHDLNGRNIPVKLDYNSNKVNVITPIEFGFYILQVVNKDNINSFKLLRK